MPWQETDPMIERRHFIQDAKSGQWAMSELCVRYGVSRVTGYKWLERHQQGGDAFLVDQSRAPLSSPSATAPELVKLILEENSRYGWGARKVRKRLILRHPDKALPARSTIADIFVAQRQGSASPFAHALEAPGSGALQHHGSQSGLDRRLQGSVPDARRSLLLSAYRRRPLQPLPALLPRAARRPYGGRYGPVSPPFS